MARQMLKPYSFLLYFLSIIAFFFIGLTYAGIVEAGKNQGLAGGAIVVGYGVMATAIGLIIALVVANKATRKTIFNLNIILALCIVAFYAYYHIKYLERQKGKVQDRQETEQPKKQTAPNTIASAEAKSIAMLFRNDKKAQSKSKMGLGLFSPNMLENKTLFFYGNLNLEKPITEHTPTDSITFKRSKYGSFNIATAPPYLVPEHLKLDYDILYFKVVSVSQDFLEIVVNSKTQQTAYVNKQAGEFQFWQAFLLSVNSVEFAKPDIQNIYIKPLSNSGMVNQPYSFMKPLKVKQSWMHVHLLNDAFKTVGKGWIKWQDHEKLLITYNLLI
ncbi:hypothetical protein [Winogradskyella schleiferi]|uniref:hypothetical protein n=1 Tax=Winogradskyella schleiferi TaxID=2686078 RepID=UPI0015BD06E3|nr:hypothetical protein [Winogradskyella schleiferi]